jgi:hypothetical protein
MNGVPMLIKNVKEPVMKLNIRLSLAIISCGNLKNAGCSLLCQMMQAYSGVLRN